MTLLNQTTDLRSSRTVLVWWWGTSLSAADHVLRNEGPPFCTFYVLHAAVLSIRLLERLMRQPIMNSLALKLHKVILGDSDFDPFVFS